jgi:hypothetical protein
MLSFVLILILMLMLMLMLLLMLMLMLMLILILIFILILLDTPYLIGINREWRLNKNYITIYINWISLLVSMSLKRFFFVTECWLK